LGPVSERGQATDWAFKSITWEECDFKCIELKEFMRTKDLHFLKVLASVRKGLVGPEVTKFLNSKILNKDEQESFVGTRIFPRKDMVQKYNEIKLKELTTPAFIFKSRYSGDTIPVQRLKRNLPIDDEVILKVGAFVMMRVNDRSKEKLFVNGTLGHVVSINGDSGILIKTLSGQYIDVQKHIFELKDSDGFTIASCTNYPLLQANAITIHKSQGGSIDSCLVSLNNLFSSGQSYVALSRLTNSEGLKITGWDRRSIFVDREVIEFYRKNQDKP
jgi:ATP-dependent DNA helicase PIF1